MSLTNCRFYEEKYPEVESFVMVNVKQIAEMGAYVKLLEYGLWAEHAWGSWANCGRQHRWHDPPLRTVATTYPKYPEAHSSRAKRGRGGAPCG